MSQSFEYVFPSIKGWQAGREYYISMCPLGLIPKYFSLTRSNLVLNLEHRDILIKTEYQRLHGIL